MGIGDMARKAKDALNSEKGEQRSDQALDRGADLANRATGGKYADKVDQGREAIDERVGTTEAGGTTETGGGDDQGTTTDSAGGRDGAGAPSTGKHRAAEADRASPPAEEGRPDRRSGGV